jgi:hypothetical protein
MCLIAKLSEDKKKKILDSIDKDGLKVYKVVVVEDDKYYPVYVDFVFPYKEKINKAKIGNLVSSNTKFNYKSGFHFFKTKAAAKRFLKYRSDDCAKFRYHTKYKMITCTVEKSWITEIGQEYSYHTEDHIGCHRMETVIVAKKAIFPKKEKPPL